MIEDVSKNTDVVKTLSMKSRALLKVIDQLQFGEEEEEFEFDGVPFLLLLTEPPTEEEKKDPEAHVNSASPAAYFPRNDYPAGSKEGYVIYLVETVPLVEKRRMVFHEVFEAILQSRGIDDENERHAATLREEEKLFGKR